MLTQRRFEDKSDTFSPFVPLDMNNTVEICNKQTIKNLESKKSILSNNKYLIYISLSLILVYILVMKKR